MLLRQLAVGLGVHRLYPGDLRSSAFVAAVERIQEAARSALAEGPVVVEVRSGRFVVAGEVVADDTTVRLAQACYERRVEHVAVDDVPNADELGAWYELLSRPPQAIEEGGGMETLVGAAGISSLRSAAGIPEPAKGEEVPAHLLGLADWAGAVPEEPTAEEVAELELRPGESARDLYRRLRALSDRIVTDGRVRSTFFRRAAWLVDSLTPSDRAVFGRLVLDRVRTESFAERYVGHLNDLALATLIVTVAGHEGSDAEELGRQVSVTAERHGTLLRLVVAVRARLGDPAPPTSGARTPEGQMSPVAPIAVDQDLVSGVATAVAQEHDQLVGDFPADAAAGRKLALLALVDVFLSEPLVDQRAELLANVTERLREAVMRGDAPLVAEVLAALRRASQVASPESSAAIERTWAQVLTGPVVAAAAVTASREDRRLTAEVLRPFGPAAVGPTLQAVGADVAEPIAKDLATLLVEVAGAHRGTLHEQVARQRPEVIARLLPLVAGRADLAVMPLLSRLALRSEPEVLNVVVDVLAEQPPSSAAPTLALIARRAPDTTLQRRCLQALSGLGAPGREELRALAEGRDEPRLPWLRRWTARRLSLRGGR